MQATWTELGDADQETFLGSEDGECGSKPREMDKIGFRCLSLCGCEHG